MMARFLFRSTIAGVVGALLVWLSLSLGPAWIEWSAPIFDVSEWPKGRRGAWLLLWMLWQLFNYLYCFATYEDF